jgi:hypothetical protein
MNPFPQKMPRPPTVSVVSHAHLLVAESGGLVTLESPEAVMDEVEFRATYIGPLLEELFAEAKKHDGFWSPDEG